MALDGLSIDEFLAMTAAKRAKKSGTVSGQLSIFPAAPTRDRQGVAASKTGAASALKSPVRLMGIDPGTRFVGWGVLELDPRDLSLRMVDCGCIAPSGKLELRFRLRQIFSELEAIIGQTRPQAAALEETFAGVNMKSAIAMGEGRGVALLCLTRANLDVLELSPRSIKQAVTGNGSSGKSHVAAMVAARLNLKKAPEPEDVTDALAAAIALSQRI
jgi:crossover junction endodeoxyribonuclease RuvC